MSPKTGCNYDRDHEGATMEGAGDQTGQIYGKFEGFPLNNA